MPDLSLGYDTSTVPADSAVMIRAAEAMGRSAKALETIVEQLGKTTRRTGREQQTAAQKAEQYTRSQKLVARIMRETGASHTAAARAVRVFGKDLDRAEKEAAQYARQMDRAEKEVKQLAAAQRAAARESKAVGSGMSFARRNAAALTRSLVATAAAAVGVHQAMRLIGESKDAALELQAINRGLSASVGGGQAAAAEYAFLRSEVERLGLVLPSAAKDLTLLSAAAKGTELAGAPVRELFSTLSGTAQVLSLSADDLSGAFVQLSQGVSKGKFELEDLKSVFERIPGSAEAMARGLGVTRAEMFAMQTAGELLTKDAIPALVKGLNEAFGGQISEGAQSDQAAINRLATAVFEFKAELGAGLLPELVKTTKELTTWLAANQEVATSIGQFVGGSLSLLVKLLAIAAENWQALTVAALAIKWHSIVAGVNALTVALRANPLIAAGAAVAAGVALVNQALKSLARESGAEIDKMTATSVDLRKSWESIETAIAGGDRAKIERTLQHITNEYVKLRAATDNARAEMERLKKVQGENSEQVRHYRAEVGAGELALRQMDAQVVALTDASLRLTNQQTDLATSTGEVTKKTKSARAEIIKQITALQVLVSAAKETGERIEDVEGALKLMEDGFEGTAAQALALVKQLRAANEQAAAFAAIQERLRTPLGRLPSILDPQPVEVDDSRTAAVEDIEARARARARESQIMLEYGINTRKTALELEIFRRVIEAGAEGNKKLEARIRAATIAERERGDQIDETVAAQGRAADAAAFVAGGVADALRGVAEDGRLDFSRMWDSFIDMGWQAIEAVIQKWLTAQFAEKSLSFSSSGGGLGGAGGVAAFAAIAVAAFEIFNRSSDRRRQRIYGTGFSINQGPLGVAGFATGDHHLAAASRTEMQQAANAVRESINDLRIGLGAFAIDLPQMTIAVRNDGEAFQLLIEGVVAGTFDSMEQAISHGLELLLANADFQGLGERTARALESQSRIGAEAFLELLPVLAEMDAVADGNTAAMGRELLVFRQRQTALDVQAESLRQLGIAEEDITAARRREIAAMVDQVRQSGLALAGISTFGSGLADFLAKAEAANQALSEEAARAAAIPERPDVRAGGGGGAGGGGASPLAEGGTGALVMGMSAADRAAMGLGESLGGLSVVGQKAATDMEDAADSIVDLDDSVVGAQDAVRSLEQIFIDMVTDIVRLQAQGSALGLLLDFQEEYGVQIASNDELRREIARIEFVVAQRQLQLTLLEMVAQAELFQLTAAQVEQYRQWAAEIGGLEFSAVTPRLGGGGGRRAAQAAEEARAAEQAAQATQTFTDALADLEVRAGGATDTARQYASEQERLRDLWEQGTLGVAELNRALSAMAEIHLDEIARQYRTATAAFGRTDIGAAVHEARERAAEAWAAALLAAADNPDAYEAARRAIEEGLEAELGQIGRDALGSLGSEFVRIRREGAAAARDIRYLMNNLEALGLTARQVGLTVLQAVLPPLLAAAIAEAERVGDIERATHLRERQAEIERKLMLLQISMWEAQLIAAGMLSEEIMGIIMDLRSDLDRPTGGIRGLVQGLGPAGTDDVDVVDGRLVPAAPDTRSAAGRAARRAAGEGGTAAQQERTADILAQLTRDAMTNAERLADDWRLLQERIEASAGSELERIEARRLAEEAYHRERLAGLRELQEELLGEQRLDLPAAQAANQARTAFEGALASGNTDAALKAAEDWLAAVRDFPTLLRAARAEILAAIGPLLAGPGASLSNLQSLPSPETSQLTSLTGPGQSLSAPQITVQAPNFGPLERKVDALTAAVVALQRPTLEIEKNTRDTASRVLPLRDMESEFARRL